MVLLIRCSAAPYKVYLIKIIKIFVRNEMLEFSFSHFNFLLQIQMEICRARLTDCPVTGANKMSECYVKQVRF